MDPFRDPPRPPAPLYRVERHFIIPALRPHTHRRVARQHDIAPQFAVRSVVLNDTHPNLAAAMVAVSLLQCRSNMATEVPI